jgi:hypothetical protein
MKVTRTLIAGLIVGSGFAGTGLAQDADGGAVGAGLRPMLFQYAARQDDAIIRAFRSTLRRDPTERELLRYRTLMVQNGWSERDVRSDLAGRSDYSRSSNRSLRPDVAVRTAYRDILGREPDAAGLRLYSDRIVREGWTEQDVREALRKSNEYGNTSYRTASADRIVRRAYQDVLHRDPDPEGLQNYRRAVLEEGWEYHDVRTALARSPERRQTRQVGRESGVNDMVRRAYLSVLGREPDAAGLQSYGDKVRREGWTEQDLVRALRDSPEYRNRR